MSPKGIRATLLFLSVCASFQTYGFAQKKPEPTRQEQNNRSRAEELANRALRRWLDEDVAFIITDEEKSAFKALRTDEEREQFIEQFWLRRDPTPDSVENEYKEDHYARIAYANERFASGKPGWRTDRGRIYIIHGKPTEIEAHASGGFYERPIDEGGGTTSTFPFEIWRYRYIEGLGNDILFEFVDPTMTGEYRLTMDPNEKDALMMVPGAGLTLDEQINGTDKAARFNITDRETSNSGMFGRSIRQNQFERLNLYVNAFRPPEIKFKDLESIVTTKLSFNLLPFDTRTDFIRVTEESVLTPITVQLRYKDLAFQEQEGIHRALANVYGKVTAINGRVAQVFEDTISQDIPAALFQQTLDSSAIYQKVIPLRPGLYKLDLVVKDIHSGNVGTVNQRLAVPRYPEEKLSTSSLILADIVENLPPNQVGSGSFILGTTKVRPNVKEEFKRDQALNVWLQVYNLKVDEKTHKPSARVETLITRNGQEVKKVVEDSTELSGAAQQMTLVQSMALGDFDPGEYSIQVKITDNLTSEIIASTGKFVVR
jgi:GWxTD domain-containing protein